MITDNKKDIMSSADKALARLAGSDGWKEAKQEIVREIISLLDLSNLELGDEKSLAIEVSARKFAAKILQNFLSKVETSPSPADTFKQGKEEEIISYIRISE